MTASSPTPNSPPIAPPKVRSTRSPAPWPCDHGPEGIRVNAICPGYIDTPMLQSFFRDTGDIESLQQAVRDVHPTRTYGTPEDIANLVLWLASDEARYASGQLWVLDGGLTAQVQQMRL